MKKKLEKKEYNHPRLVLQNSASHASWTPIAAILLTGVIGYLTYEVCSHIPVVDYCTNAAIHVFG